MSAVTELGLETIVGSGGQVTLGWVGPRVFYVRFVGTLSRELGEAFLVRLRHLTLDVKAFQYFSDARALKTYDVYARREFVDFVLERPHQLEGSVSLTWKEGVSTASRAFVALVGQTFEVLVDDVEFERRLFAVAPLARSMLTTLSEETSDPRVAESPCDSIAVRLLRAAFEPSSIKPLDEHAYRDANRILNDIFRWLQSHDSYRCELEASRGNDSAPLVWDIVQSIAQIAGYETSRHGNTVFVSRRRSASLLH